MERKAEHDIAGKLKVLNHTNEHGYISKTYHYFGIFCETFVVWRRTSKADIFGEKLLDHRYAKSSGILTVIFEVMID